GFPATMLEHFGQPYRSSKGAGHGLGLFLVVTVARRLGGRVEATNLAGGGAEVRLLIPVAPPQATEV
ncbi:MAG: ATP-binding protein, partial [Janthinobacterium lividum]